MGYIPDGGRFILDADWKSLRMGGYNKNGKGK